MFKVDCGKCGRFKQLPCTCWTDEKVNYRTCGNCGTEVDPLLKTQTLLLTTMVKRNINTPLQLLMN